jgi:hypothetical protein
VHLILKSLPRGVDVQVYFGEVLVVPSDETNFPARVEEASNVPTTAGP